MKPFEEIASLLPLNLREGAMSLPITLQEQAEEFRLRVGFPARLVVQGREIELFEICTVKSDDLYSVLEQASHHSVHTVLNQMQCGFVTVRGGHRIGLCGLAAVEKGNVYGFRQLSSLNLRIAREIKGVAENTVLSLMKDGSLQSTLIVAPPGAGKTTFLRDLIRCVSDGKNVPSQRVGVADERGELAALWEGRPQMDLGISSDVLEGLPKAEAILMLMRGMNPQVIAVDEITQPEDTEAIMQAAGCGVTLLATAHGKSIADMKLRPIYRDLLQNNIFRHAVFIRRGDNGCRETRVEEIPWYGS